MVSNYLHIAIRHLVRYRLYAAINICGLATAIAFCLLTWIFIDHEWSYDRFHEAGDRMYRVCAGKGAGYGTGVPVPLGPRLKDVAGVDYSTWVVRRLGKFGDGKGGELGRIGAYVGDDFFDMFSFRLQSGDPHSAIRDPMSVVLTESLAHDLFGDTNAVGREVALRLDDMEETFTVSGIVEDPADNSTIQFGFLTSYDHMWRLWHKKSDKENWDFWVDSIYARLTPGRDPDEVATAIRDLIPDSPDKPNVFLQPISDLYFGRTIASRMSSPTYSYVLSGVSFVLLVVACINFANLSTGLASTRVTEVGIRKVVGARRKHILAQVWGEVFLISVFSVCVGAALAELFLPTFNGLADTHLDLMYDPVAIRRLVVVAVGVSLLAGIHPAITLSGYSPISVLKRAPVLGSAGPFTRTLLVTQFGFAVAFVVGVLLMDKQISAVQGHDLGFDSEQLVNITNHNPGDGRADSWQSFERFRNLVASNPEVVSMTGSYGFFSTPLSERLGTETERINTKIWGITEEYLETMGARVVAGRNYREGDGNVVLISKSLASALPYDDPIGQPLYGRRGSPTIIGVIEDLTLRSLHRNPVHRAYYPKMGYAQIIVRIAPHRVQQTLDDLREKWAEANPNMPFDYEFADDRVDRYYRRDRKWQSMIGYAAGIVILMSCMGAFGVTSLTVARRTKEIGVRKVLGATVRNLVSVLSRETLTHMAIANVIAWPLVWYGIRQWLQTFTVRTPMDLWQFAIGGLAVTGVVLVAVSFQVIRAAIQDPVRALRYE